MEPRHWRASTIAMVCIGLILSGISENGEPSFSHAMTQLRKLDIRSEVRVDARRVNLLDLCDPTGIPEDWKSAMAGTDIGETPATGTEKVIQPAQLRTFIEQFISSRGGDPSSVMLSMPERISVKQQSISITREEIEQIYREFILKSAPWNQSDITIKAIYFNGSTVELPPGAMTYEVVPNARERFIGNVTVTIQFSIDGQRERSVRVSGKVEVYQSVVHAVRPLKRNDIVTDSDVEIQKINISEMPDRYATTLDSTIGKRVLRDVGLRQPISLADVDSPVVMKRGSAVTIIYTQPGLRLTAKGQTKEDGDIGNTVRVVNLSTNKTIFCRVIDATTVQAAP